MMKIVINDVHTLSEEQQVDLGKTIVNLIYHSGFGIANVKFVEEKNDPITN